MLVRKFVRPCLMLKKTSTLTPCISAYHRTCLKMRKNEFKSASHKNPSELLLELNTSVPSKILLSLEANKDIINGSHIVMALTKFLKVCLNKKSDKEPINLRRDEYFKQLNSLIKANIYKLSGSEAVQILDIFCKMDVPNELDTMSSLIKHVIQNIDKLSFIEICLFSFTVKKTKNTHSIKRSIPLLQHQFIIKLSREFNEHSIDHLDYGLAFASTFLENNDLLNSMLSKLKNYNGEIPIRNAITILESICKRRVPVQKSIEIYEKIKDAIHQNISDMNPDQVIYAIYIISKYIKNSNRTTSKFYDEKLFDKLAQKIVNDDMGLEKALSALKSFNFIKHESKGLLNYSSASYFERSIMSEQLIQDESGKMLILINGLAMSQHKTVFWDQIENFLTKRKEELLKYDHYTLCIFSLNLLCLNYYPYYLLEKVFDDKHDYSEDDFMHFTFCKIYQKIKSDPKYDGPLPSQSQIESLHQLHEKSWRRDEKYIFQFYDPLVEGLGDKKYLKTNLVTRLFHLIDYVAVFDENGDPVPINTSDNYETGTKEYLEDLNVPPNCKIVCILNLPYYWYWKNTKKLLGMYVTLIDSLETLNCLVVSINNSDYNAIPDEQRKEFLMDKINSKLNSVK